MVAEALTPEGAADMARVFKVLGDPVRLRVLSLIAARRGGEVCVCEITDAFDLTGPTISYHLRQLRETGLVDCQRRATWVYYRIVPERLAALAQFLDPAGLMPPVGSEPSAQARRSAGTTVSGVTSSCSNAAAPPSNSGSTTVTDKPTVLFVCVHNAGRSQMAAGWLRHLAGASIDIRSAGSEPADQVNPVAVEAMREVGIDISDQSPKLLDRDTAQAADVIITMGCGDACPTFPGKRYEDWTLDDPADRDLDTVRTIRDDIRGRVERLLTELPTPAA